METAKVDIRKLQALNDRINQCIDALNQVRLSVHGLSHATPAGPFIPPGATPFAQTPFGAAHAGLGSFPQVPAYPLPQVPGYFPGFSHATPVLGGPATFSSGFVPGLNPFAGLSHSSPEESFGRPVWTDPFLAARIAQTFPYAQYPFPAVVTIV
jgi:hypothetical protein